MSIDTVSDLPRRNQYEAVAAQDTFDYAFAIFSDGDLVVDVDGVTQALNTDYTVTGAGDDAGGTIVFTDPLDGGEIVTIYSSLTIERLTDYQQNGPWSSQDTNDELDRLIIIAQELRDANRRAVRLPMTSEVADADMEISPLSSWADKYLTFDSDGKPTPAALVAGTLTQAIIGVLMQPQTTAETTAGVTANTIYPSLPYDVRRAGLVPNSSGARAANTAALKALLNYDVDGPRGWFIFPNTTGDDTYYFNMDDITIRDGCCIDFQGCMIDVAGSYSASHDLHGFMEFIRDVQVCNGHINFDYDGSSGTNNGALFRIGSRNNYVFGSTFPSGIEDEDLAESMGNCSLHDLTITYGNAGAPCIFMLGGLDRVHLKNISLDGDATADNGIYYEFGHWHYSATAALLKSSHATNLLFENISIKNMKNTTPSEAFSLIGAMSASVNGLFIDGGYNSIVCRPGEALYYNMGTPWVDAKAHLDFRNVVCTDSASTPVTFRGAESKSGGYLSGEAGVTEAKQCDLISFSLNGFSVEGTMIVSGKNVALYNGVQRNGSASGGILLQDECISFDIANVRILDNAGIGLRFQSGTNIFSVARLKSGSVRNCLIAGATGVGTNPANSKGVIFDACRFGYETIFDGVDESTQTNGVSNTSTALNTTVRNCYGGTTSGGAVMYTNAGSGGWKYAMLENIAGLKTTSGQWTVDGSGIDADVGDAATTLDPGVDLPTQRYATPITADRAVTLGTSSAVAGDEFHIIRTAACTGAFNVNVGTGPLKALASAGTWCKVVFDGSAWLLKAYGAL